MDENEFSFEALFRCAEFKRYTSPAYKDTTDKFYEFLESRFRDYREFSEIESESTKYCTAAHESGFMQGFCFAVKLMRFLQNI